MRAFTLLFIVTLAGASGCKREVAPAAVKSAASPPPAGRLVELSVTDDGFVPDNVKLRANEPVTFRVTRKTDETCAKDLLIEGTDIHLALPLETPVDVTWTPTKAGQVKFGCAMDMMIGGVLLVE